MIRLLESMSKTAHNALTLLIALCILPWAAPSGMRSSLDGAAATCCCGIDLGSDGCCGGGEDEGRAPPCECDDLDPSAPMPPAAPGVGPVVWVAVALPAADPTACAPVCPIGPTPVPRVRSGPLRHVIDCVFLL